MSTASSRTQDPTRRNVAILAACQALNMAGNNMMMLTAPLVGLMLTPYAPLATLPLAIMFTAMMITTIPASLLMRRVGRRAGFSVGAVGVASGMLLASWAVVTGSFWLFTAAAIPIGAGNAFAQFYRFAAADTAGDAFKARAISLVLAGGVVAAVLGPELAKATRDLFPPFLFAASYTAIAGLALLTLLLVQLVRIPMPKTTATDEPARPLRTIMRTPGFIVAVLAGAGGFASMSLVMTATPLAMAACGFGFDESAFVIQWHVLAMFAPSFVTGRIIGWIGAPRVIALGVAATIICVVINLASIAFEAFWIALILLGIGWNFMYVGGSALLTQIHNVAERAKVQAANDFIVVTAVALSSFTSGAVHTGLGWAPVNLLALPLVMLPAAALLWVVRAAPRDAAPAK